MDADALDRLADAGHFVCAEVIGDDDVPGMQGGHEDLFDIGEEARPVDGAVEDPGRGQASHPQRCEKRTGLPPGARRVVVDAGPAEGPTIPPQEIVRNAGFIEKNQTCRIPGRRGGVPHDPRGRLESRASAPRIAHTELVVRGQGPYGRRSGALLGDRVRLSHHDDPMFELFVAIDEGSW